jgi:chromosome segregation ATPase
VNREVEATKSIDQCNEILDASEQEKVQLKTDLDEARSEISELQDLRSKSSNDDEIALKSRETIRELSESVAMLEDQLKEQEQEALDAVDQWQSACSDLETKCANLELVINDSREMISEELRSCNESYGIQIEKLEATSKIVESSLRENLDSAKAEIERLVEVQEVERRERVDDQLQSQAKLEAEVERNHEARDEIRKLSSRLEEINTDSEDTLNQWTGMYLFLFCANFY